MLTLGYEQRKHGRLYPRKTTAYVMIMVPAAGLEPARPYGREILSLMCLPFHHAGTRGAGGQYPL
ncbi:hypothetical protein RV134_310301 [Roseovarius sp. EC-HK134]|nr:hypothetical protein RV420_360407 [Roseovarius sp. EC-SD190]VVT21123.1 hypothetical protein RV134_310301 [Roseovarius sp. EC-HK134]